jgi:hypothetical protein
MDGTGEHHSERGQPGPEDQKSYALPHMWTLDLGQKQQYGEILMFLLCFYKTEQLPENFSFFLFLVFENFRRLLQKLIMPI